MAFTDKEVYDLNNMNVAAQNVSLGDVLNGMSGGTQSISAIIQRIESIESRLDALETQNP